LFTAVQQSWKVGVGHTFIIQPSGHTTDQSNGCMRLQDLNLSVQSAGFGNVILSLDRDVSPTRACHKPIHCLRQTQVRFIAEYLDALIADFADVGQAVRSMSDTGFGRCRTAAGRWG
jgi:hypothetical protein